MKVMKLQMVVMECTSTRALVRANFGSHLIMFKTHRLRIQFRSFGFRSSLVITLLLLLPHTSPHKM